MSISSSFATTIYGGGSISTDVPASGPVAIAGHVYEIEPRKCTRQTIPALRSAADMGQHPGQQSFNTNGIWSLDMTDWRHGAGQSIFDSADSMPSRFFDSKGIDCWDPHHLSLLAGTTRILASVANNLQALTVTSTLVLVADGTNLRWTTDRASFAAATPAAGTITGLATDGTTVFVACSGSILQRGTAGTPGLSNLGTLTADTVCFGNGRLIATRANRIVELDAAGAPVASSLDFSHRNPSFVWRGVVASTAGFYAWGDAGGYSEVYFVTLDNATTALAPPRGAWSVPPGEVVTVLGWSSNVVVIGTTAGFRLATADDNGRLTAGALVLLPGGCTAVAPWREYVYFSWATLDGVSSGLGRMDLARLTDPQGLTPAYASDLMADGQAKVCGVAMFGSHPVFTVAGLGAFTDTVAKVPSGTLRSGWLQFSTVEPKVAIAVDVAHEPLHGRVDLSIGYDRRAEDGGQISGVSSSAVQGSTGPDNRFSTVNTQFRQAELIVALVRDQTDSSIGPVVERLSFHAIATPLRSDQIVLALRLWADVDGFTQVGMPSQRFFDTVAETMFLRDLVKAATVVPFQWGRQIENVIVTAIEAQPDKLDATWGDPLGLVGVTLLTVEA